MCSRHLREATYAHIGWIDVERIEKMMPQSFATGAEPKYDHLLLTTELVVSMIFLVAIYYCLFFFIIDLASSDVTLVSFCGNLQPSFARLFAASFDA